jgi:hypothetical protein
MPITSMWSLSFRLFNQVGEDIQKVGKKCKQIQEECLWGINKNNTSFIIGWSTLWKHKWMMIVTSVNTET